jgi:hypothetical protein
VMAAGGELPFIRHRYDAKKHLLPVSSPEDALARARTALGKTIEYKLGKGRMNPGPATPPPAGQGDCSGHIAWCLGLSGANGVGGTIHRRLQKGSRDIAHGCHRL